MEKIYKPIAPPVRNGTRKASQMLLLLASASGYEPPMGTPRRVASSASRTLSIDDRMFMGAGKKGRASRLDQGSVRSEFILPSDSL